MEQPLPTRPAPEPSRPPGSSDWSRVTAPGAAPASSFTVGYLVGTSFRTWARHALLFALIGGVGSVPMAFVTYRLYLWLPMVQDPAHVQELLAELPKRMGGFFLGWLVSLVVMSLMMAAICQGAAQVLRKEPARPGTMLAAAIHRAPYVLAVVLLATLAAMATACTLVVPFILMVAWCASVPATVIERLGPIRALGRSWDLTRGHRWPAFAGLAVLTVCLMAAGGILQAISLLVVRAVSGPQLDAGQAMALPMAIYQVFAGMLGTISTVALAVAHHGLRVAKEGGDPATLAQVFE